MRVIRLVLGLVIISQAWVASDTLLGVLGVLFAGMALFNTGCCAMGSCAVPDRTVHSKKDEGYDELVEQK